MKKRIFIIFLVCLVIVTSSDAQFIELYLLVPKDVKVSEGFFEEKDEVREIMGRIQKFISREMKKHGYGEKTFTLITDRFNRARVHVIESKKPLEHFQARNDNLTDLFDLNVVQGERVVMTFVAGAERVGNSDDQLGFVKSLDSGVKSDFFAFTPLANKKFKTVIAGHEFAHTLRLEHHFLRGKMLMNPKIYGGMLSWKEHTLEEFHLDAFEASWLNSHFHLNGRKEIGSYPIIKKKSEPTGVFLEGKWHVSFAYDIESDDGFRRVQLLKRSKESVSVLRSMDIRGFRGTVVFQVRAARLENASDIVVKAINCVGGITVFESDFNMPEFENQRMLPVRNAEFRIQQ